MLDPHVHVETTCTCRNLHFEVLENRFLHFGVNTGNLSRFIIGFLISVKQISVLITSTYLQMDSGFKRRLVHEYIVGTLRYGDADALKYATVKESLGRERNVCGGKTKLRFVASDAISFASSLIWLISAGETRELLFISNAMVFIADAEFLLLYEESRSDNLDFPNENFRCFLCRTKMELSVQPI